MTEEQLQTIKNSCSDLGYDIHENYSGRGMFGKTCFGFSTSERAAPIKLLSAIFENLDAEELENFGDFLVLFKGLCEDNLGRDTIYYFKYGR